MPQLNFAMAGEFDYKSVELGWTMLASFLFLLPLLFATAVPVLQTRQRWEALACCC